MVNFRKENDKALSGGGGCGGGGDGGGVGGGGGGGAEQEMLSVFKQTGRLKSTPSVALHAVMEAMMMNPSACSIFAIELVDMSTSIEPQTRGGLVLQSPGDPTPLVTLELSMSSDQPQPFVDVLKAADERLLTYCPCREISATEAFPPGFGRNAQRISADEISATRAFPPGCGRNAHRISTDKHLNSVSSEKGNSVGCERTILEHRPSEKTVRNEANHAGKEVQDGYACRHSLVGASNCPCKQGKQVTIYNSSGTIGINAKKHKLMEMGKSVSASSEKKHKTENSGGLITEKKVPPKGKVAYLDPGQLFAMYKDDNAWHDTEDENVINGCKANVSHNTDIKALNLFRNILKEEGKMSKERGNSTHRIDLLAYECLKKTHMWVNPGTAILGSIPGVTVGDKFQYRVELLIVGLHRPLESGIDYLKKGGKIIATSIVASGGYDNDTSDPDVLVYSGQGSKSRKGDKRPKDQKLKGGNLALKNSIGEKIFVRIVSRGTIISDYVYNGFYLVEQYWAKRGDYGNLIFKFQLRRVADQLKLHSRKN
ncbi:histone-lysine N-methyltransferase, H3 lysine-9 specific SUVH6-like [Telopea speciosissima]|uniref:histone-lysine N-methyltransferase, H3 lysine-9 specific SUVH6-like n=1 Tax=Telopea speciosissima TaxID=54955 RepID=UPI001CC5207C|nr:histone-lysine N-methyltransferase, H3 lysine-9 specific SUVH6-like [Telopea speciosissima]